eukprot:scaffold124022_cov67-Phaeocystis_antarctica.AAC.3
MNPARAAERGGGRCYGCLRQATVPGPRRGREGVRARDVSGGRVADRAAGRAPSEAPVDQKKQTATTSILQRSGPPSRQMKLAMLSGKMQ